MKIRLDNIQFSLYAKIRSSNNCKYLYIISQPHIQHVFNAENGSLIKVNNLCSSFIYIDYDKAIDYESAFLNSIDFYQFENGWLYDYNKQKINSIQIPSSNYKNGILESFISVNLQLLIIITDQCPIECSDDKKANEIIELKNVYRNFGRSEKSITLNFFSFSGKKIRTFILNDCLHNFKSKFSITSGKLLISSYEYSYLFNCISGELLKVFEGEEVSFLDESHIGHWEWYGYDVWHPKSQILNNNLEVIKSFDSALENEQVSTIWWNNVHSDNVEAYSFVSFRLENTSDFNYRVLKFKIDNPETIMISDEKANIQNENFALLGLTNDELLFMKNHENVLELFRIDKKKLHFSIYRPAKFDTYKSQSITHEYIDLHTLHSKKLPNGRFDTKHTEVGELLYQYKYCFNKNVEDKLLQLLTTKLRTLGWVFDVIVPIPPTKLDRIYQPVFELAERMKYCGYKVDLDYLIKIKTTQQVKTISNKENRIEALKDAFYLKDENRYVNKDVLLFDDIWRSGDSVKKVAELIYYKGKASSVKVLTITKTKNRHD